MECELHADSWTWLIRIHGSDGQSHFPVFDRGLGLRAVVVGAVRCPCAMQRSHFDSPALPAPLKIAYQSLKHKTVQEGSPLHTVSCVGCVLDERRSLDEANLTHTSGTSAE